MSRQQIQILNLETFECIKSISMYPYTGFDNPVILSNGHLALNCVFQRHTPSIIILNCNNDYSCNKIISCGYGTAFYFPVVSLNSDLFAFRRNDFIYIHEAGNEYECVKNFKGHQRHIECLISMKDFLISCSFDKTIRIWDLKDDYKCIKTIFDDEVVSSLIALSGGFFASYIYDGKIKLWDVVSFSCLNVINVDKLVYLPKMALLKDNRLVVQLYKKIIILEY
jgi:WD40 repeat protein